MPCFTHFVERYSYKQTCCFRGRSSVRWSGAQRPLELNCLLGTVMMRRLKQDVLTQLPAKRRMRVPLDPEKMNQERAVQKRRLAYITYTLRCHVIII